MEAEPKEVTQQTEGAEGARRFDDEPDHGTGGGGGTKTAGYPVRQPPPAAGANGTRKAG